MITSRSSKVASKGTSIGVPLAPGAAAAAARAAISLPAVTRVGPRLQLVNGEFAVDRGSLVARPRTDEELRAQSALLEAVDDTDTFATAVSFSKRAKRAPWSDDDTRRFFRCLRMYGLDFGMICTAFPGRERSQIKQKYFKELRERPALVNAALMCPVPVDVAATRARIKAHIAREKLAGQAAKVGVGAQHASEEAEVEEDEGEADQDAHENVSGAKERQPGHAEASGSSRRKHPSTLEAMLEAQATAAGLARAAGAHNDDDIDDDDEDEDDDDDDEAEEDEDDMDIGLKAILGSRHRADSE